MLLAHQEVSETDGELLDDLGDPFEVLEVLHDVISAFGDDDSSVAEGFLKEVRNEVWVGSRFPIHAEQVLSHRIDVLCNHSVCPHGARRTLRELLLVMPHGVVELLQLLHARERLLARSEHHQARSEHPNIRGKPRFSRILG